MGSWSIYCGISQLAITAGQPCVLLPLKPNPHHRSGYFTHIPATLPIFGTYDDYGGIEEIEDDASTALIEAHFGCKIEEFAHYFTRGVHRSDESDFPKKLSEVEEIKDWTFMFIDRKVWDFLSKHTPKSEQGHLDFGNPNILKLLGFENVGESGIERYTQKWQNGKKILFSDGNWVHLPDGQGIYSIKGKWSSLEKFMPLPPNAKWMQKLARWQMWEYLEEEKALELIGWVIGIETHKLWMRKLTSSLSKEKIEEILGKNPPPDLAEKYSDDLKTFGAALCDLTTLAHNLHPMSGDFSPYKPYLTPQCGEIEEHQVLLNKFAAINKSYVDERRRESAEWEEKLEKKKKKS